MLFLVFSEAHSLPALQEKSSICYQSRSCRSRGPFPSQHRYVTVTLLPCWFSCPLNVTFFFCIFLLQKLEIYKHREQDMNIFPLNVTCPRFHRSRDVISRLYAVKTHETLFTSKKKKTNLINNISAYTCFV